MGKPTGFMEYHREVQADVPPEQRVWGWQEFHGHLSEAKLREQGARCMDCGIPFCHTGTLLSGMAAGCPLHNLIPEWNDLVYRGLWPEALARLHRTNNFPEFTGRVCPAPCEGSCVLGIHAPPVTIKCIECAIVDMGFEMGWVRVGVPAHATGKRIAIVGSGPSGLACADQLHRAGHEVTVYEREDRPGGLLMYGIPNMKLDKGIVQRRLDLMADAGVRFVTRTAVGKDIPAARIVKDYDAVVLCCGATKPRDLSVPGRTLQGVHFAMDFLRENTKSILSPGGNVGRRISATGRNVVVIGGGDTGTDCVGTAIRQGCRGITQLEIMPRPPQERPLDNPWPEWPRVHRLDYGQEEAQARFGRDPREYLVMTTGFTGDDDGRVRTVHTVEVEWVKGPGGRPSPRGVPGTEKTWPADLVLVAMGFVGPEDAILSELGVERDERSNVKADYGRFMTSIQGVFAAGDMRRGQSLVVWAIHEGRSAAREVDRYLMGNTRLP